MSDLIVIENTNLEIIEVAPRIEVTPQFNNTYQEFIGEMDDRVDDAAIYASNAANSAGQAATSAATAASQASAASNSASQAASFVGGNWPLPHGHVTGPIAVDPTFQRLSDAYDDVLKRYEYNQRRWNQNGTLIEEGTTNLLPAWAEDFVTGWTNGTGETCTVTDYPINIPGIGDVVAKRITGNGAGSDRVKYKQVISGLINPHSTSISVFAMVMSGSAQILSSSSSYVSVSSTMARVSAIVASRAATTDSFNFSVTSPSNILDIVVYAPQIEAKPYATSYTPPGTTRAAESLALPINAYQKNLLTANQATGGDTLGNTTGFSGAKTTETITRDTAEAFSGTGCIKVTTLGNAQYEGVYLTNGVAISNAKIYTASLRIKGTGTVSLFNVGPASPLGSPITLNNQFQLLTATFTSNSGVTSFMVLTTGTEAATFYIDGLQLEEGTTASDFALPAVDYSNALIDPAQPFSIEFDCTPWVDDKSVYGYFFGVNVDNANRIEILSNITDGIYRAQIGGTPIVSSVVVASGVKKLHKISVASDKVVTYSLNGVTIGTATWTAPATMLNVSAFIGANRVGTSHRNASISNVRIRKGVALTAAELAYTGKLLPDEYTTFFSDMKESISSRPFVRKDGKAQNVVLAGDSPNQNAIINGDFRLASRGASFTDPSNGAYLLDGTMFFYNGTGASRVISQQSATVGQQEVPGAINYIRTVQSVAPTGQTAQYYKWRIEDARLYSGNKVRLSLYARSPEQITLPFIKVYQEFGSGGSTSVAAQNVTNIKLSSKTGRYKFEFVMPSVAGKTLGAGHHIYIELSHPLNAAFTLDIADIELKPADAPDSYYRRDLQMLQQLRNRYLQTLPANLQLRAVNVQANYIDFESVVLPTEMRATPALSGTYAETTNWKILNTAAAQTTGFTLALLNASANQVAFRATKNAHGLTDATLQLVTNVLVSAEL